MVYHTAAHFICNAKQEKEKLLLMTQLTILKSTLFITSVFVPSGL